MREIKFRGKRINDPIIIERYAPNGWVYGDFIDCSDESYIAPKDISGEFYVERNYKFRANDIEARVMMAQVDPKTIGQYTGLTDKNGKEIYEGDIVCTRFPSNCEHAGQICSIGDVRYEKGCFGAVWTSYENAGWHFLRRFDDEIIDDIEVIGNIWDTPELLKVER